MIYKTYKVILNDLHIETNRVLKVLIVFKTTTLQNYKFYSFFERKKL